MDILVFGAGAVGGYLGGRLALAGHNVTLIVRSPAAEAIQSNGLTISEGNSPSLSRPAAVPSLRQAMLEKPHHDMVLLCVKAYDAPAALDEMVAFGLSPSLLITLQNGIGVEEPFIEEFGEERVIAGSLTTPLVRESNRSVSVERADRGLALAPTKPREKIDDLVELFNEAGITTVGMKNYQAMKWSKAMLNMIGNATSAILNRHPRIIYDYEPTFRLEMRMLREMLAVMRKLKLKPVDLPGTATGQLVFAVKRLPEGLVRPILSRIVGSGRGDKLPSFHLDLAAGKSENEVVFHNGAVAEVGQEIGVATHTNAALNDILLKLVRKEVDYEIFNGKPRRLVAEVQRYRRAASGNR